MNSAFDQVLSLYRQALTLLTRIKRLEAANLALSALIKQWYNQFELLNLVSINVVFPNL